MINIMKTVTIHPKAALNYFIRCYEGCLRGDTGVYHNRFYLKRLEALQGRTVNAIEETRYLVVTESEQGRVAISKDDLLYETTR